MYFGMRALAAILLWTCAAEAQARRPLIAIAGISHESASFNPAKTTLAEFGWPALPSLEKMRAQHAQANTTVSGYLEGAARYGFDIHPVMAAGASPKGPVEGAAFETMAAELIRRLRAAPKLDGILMPLHGAMVVETFPSGDAELVRRVREAMGRSMPIVVTHDFHANITPDIVRDSDALITYKENPHIDPKERGMQAARIVAGMAAGTLKPVQAVVKPPMMYNIVYQHTKRPPLLPIVEESRRLEQNPKILACSVSGGYQYADVPFMGPSVVVVTDGDRALAEREAKRLSDMLWATRDRLVLNLPDAAEAVRRASAAPKFPVALIDTGDNIGGGSSGDSTFILAELLKQKASGWVMVIADPEAMRAAARAGVGQPFDSLVGGKTDKLHGEPVRVRGRVRSLHEGRYVETEVRHGGGRYWDMGHTAVMEVEGSTPDLPNLLLVTMKRSSPNSLHQLISVGVYPQRQRILVVKGAIAPRAAYEPVAAQIIEVDTPGVTAVNPARFTYKHVRRPLFGLGR
jgi:microcystin degradation protein MlrC